MDGDAEYDHVEAGEDCMTKFATGTIYGSAVGKY